MILAGKDVIIRLAIPQARPSYYSNLDHLISATATIFIYEDCTGTNRTDGIDSTRKGRRYKRSVSLCRFRATLQLTVNK